MVNEFLSNFALKWEFIPGKDNPADSLSRLCIMTSTRIDVDKSIHAKRWHKQHIGGASQIGETLIENIRLPEIKKAYKNDPWFKVTKNIATLFKKDGLWWRGDQLVIPNNERMKEKVLLQAHNSKFAGHPGRTKTYDLVTRQYWWPGVRKSVTKHCHECDSCQRVRQDNQKSTGLYQPLPIGHAPWASVTMDLITQLPPTKDGNTAIVVFTDKLTKMIHIIPTITKYTAPILADIFLQNVFRFHGMPETFLSDRDSKFNSTFWKEFFRICNVKINMSSSYHPQTDGQTEVVKKSIENYRRRFGAEKQDDWDT